MRISEYGLWENPYEDVIVPSNRITMQYAPAALATTDTGYQEITAPGLEYDFPGNYVLEQPLNKPKIVDQNFTSVKKMNNFVVGPVEKFSKLKEKDMSKSLNKKSLENDTQGVTMEDYISNQRNDFVSRLKENNMNAIADESFGEMVDALYGFNNNEQQVAQNGTEQRPYGSKVYLINRQDNAENNQPTEYTITNYNLPLLRRQGRGNYIAKDKDGNTIKIREDLYNDWLTQNANPYIPVYKSATRYNLAGDGYWRSTNADVPDIMYIGDENFDYTPKFPIDTELLIQNNGRDSYSTITRRGVLPAFPEVELKKIEDDNDRARYLKNYLKNRATEFGYLNENEAVHGQFQKPKHSSFKNDFYSDKELEDLIDNGTLFLHEEIEPVVIKPQSIENQKEVEDPTPKVEIKDKADSVAVTSKDTKAETVATHIPVSKKEPRQGKKLRAFKYQGGGELDIRLPHTEYNIPGINAMNDNMRTAGIRRMQFNGPSFDNFSLGRFNMRNYTNENNELDINAINNSDKFKERGLRLGTDPSGQLQLFDKDGNIVDSNMKFKGRIPKGTAYAMTNMALNSVPVMADIVNNIRSPRETFSAENVFANIWGGDLGMYGINDGINQENRIG